MFRRTDLDGFEVEAICRNVAKVSYATSLMKKGVLISTTEHLLSAFIGMGVDNAIVELDNLELPILDGSALPFIEMITNAGLRQQRRKRVYLKILRPYEMREGDKFIGVYPSERYSVSYAIDFPHPLIGSERFQVELSNGSYMREIASARTFGFLHQQREMLNMGLIRGASRENCIVLTRDDIDNPPLRYRRRVRAPQSARPDRRSGAVRQTRARLRQSRSRRTRDAHRNRFPHSARPDVRGRDHAERSCGRRLACRTSRGRRLNRYSQPLTLAASASFPRFVSTIVITSAARDLLFRG